MYIATKMKKVIYTCITGNYDSLMQPEAVDGSFDYVCFSDTVSSSRVGVWEIRPFPVETSALSPIMKSRYPKILPHRSFDDGEYDVWVWMDANIRIVSDRFYDTVDRLVAGGCDIAQVPHLDRDCIYDEIPRCYIDMRLGLGQALRQRRHLEGMGFPRHFGLMENNLILRVDRGAECVARKVSESWWAEFERFPVRDQLSLMPVYRSLHLMPELFFGRGRNVRKVDCLEIVRHAGIRNVSEIRGAARLLMKLRWTAREIAARLLLGYKGR